MQSGIVLLPGGLLLLVILPFVGILLGKFEPSWIVRDSAGIVMATGLFQLSHLDLNAGWDGRSGLTGSISRTGTAFSVRADQRDGVLFRAEGQNEQRDRPDQSGAEYGRQHGNFVRDHDAGPARAVSSGMSCRAICSGQSAFTRARSIALRIMMMIQAGADAVHAAMQAQGMICMRNCSGRR